MRAESTSTDRDRRSPLELARLAPLMERTSGRPEIVVALIDGPVSTGIAAIPDGRIREAPGALSAACSASGSAACKHGTFVASILAADRDAGAPGICPGCALLARPIFSEDRYIARRLCWVMTIEGLDTYLLRVDVTEAFPFLVSKMAPFYDR